MHNFSFFGYTSQGQLKLTGIHLQFIEDQELILTMEKIIRGGIANVMGDRYVRIDANSKVPFLTPTTSMYCQGPKLYPTKLT